MDKQNYKFEPRKYRFPTRFRPQYPRSSLCSVVVLTHDFRRLEAHSVRLGRRLNKLEDNRHVNFSNILQWYSSTPMAMTILAPPNNRRTTPSRVRPCAGVEAPPRPWQWRDYPSPQCCHCFAAEPSFTLLPKLAVILHSPQSRERCLL